VTAEEWKRFRSMISSAPGQKELDDKLESLATHMSTATAWQVLAE
jgi:hypothetical protein